jgi:hypothetical protein
MEHQDWSPVTLRHRRGGSAAAAAAAGEKCIVGRDCGASERAHARKLEAADGPARIKRISAASKQELIQARLSRGLTQDKADAACALPKHTFRDIESAKMLPGPSILRAISRELSVNLRFE